MSGDLREFACLRVEIVGPGELSHSELALQSAKTRLRRLVDGTVGYYGGRTVDWDGDCGSFLFRVANRQEFDEAVLAGFRILESLPGINEELRLTTGLAERLSARVSLDSGLAAHDEDPRLIWGGFIDAFLENAREVGLVGEVTVTERVYIKVDEAIRGRLAPFKSSEDLDCEIYKSSISEAKAWLPARWHEHAAPPIGTGLGSSRAGASCAIETGDYATMRAIEEGKKQGLEAIKAGRFESEADGPPEILAAREPGRRVVGDLPRKLAVLSVGIVAILSLCWALGRH